MQQTTPEYSSALAFWKSRQLPTKSKHACREERQQPTSPTMQQTDPKYASTPAYWKKIDLPSYCRLVLPPGWKYDENIHPVDPNTEMQLTEFTVYNPDGEQVASGEILSKPDAGPWWHQYASHRMKSGKLELEIAGVYHQYFLNGKGWSYYDASSEQWVPWA